MAIPLQTRILVADDHPIVLQGLKTVLNAQPDFEVVARGDRRRRGGRAGALPGRPSRHPRPANWVSLALYERRLRLAEPDLRVEQSLSGFLARAAAVTPRAGSWQRNLDAFSAQARAVLRDLRRLPRGGLGPP